MLENDYNIKPVENMPNVGSLAPIDQHSQKRRKQEQRKGATSRHNNPEAGSDETATPDAAKTEAGYIDYRA
jgi:hypothetical protein